MCYPLVLHTTHQHGTRRSPPPEARTPHTCLGCRPSHFRIHDVRSRAGRICINTICILSNTTESPWPLLAAFSIWWREGQQESTTGLWSGESFLRSFVCLFVFVFALQGAKLRLSCWPETHRDSPASAFRVLGLKTCLQGSLRDCRAVFVFLSSFSFRLVQKVVKNNKKTKVISQSNNKTKPLCESAFYWSSLSCFRNGGSFQNQNCVPFFYSGVDV